MKVTSKDSQQFSLESDGKTIGKLVYPKWYSLSAAIFLDDKKYRIAPKDFWGTTIELKEGETCLLKLKINWKGNAVMHALQSGNKYELKQKGLLDNRFVLVDQEANQLMVMRTDFQWTKLNFDYHLESSEAFQKQEQFLLLVLAAVHYVNYYISMTTAVVA